MKKMHSVRDDMFFKDQCQYVTHYLYAMIYRIILDLIKDDK